MRPQIAVFSLFVLCFLASIGGCGSPKMEAKVAVLEQTLSQTKREMDELTVTVSDLVSDLENDRRRAAREKYCQNSQIAQFMSDLQEGLPDTCTADSMNNALTFMRKLPCGIAHLKPEAGLLSLRPTRVGQIRGILDPERLHSSTRLVVMAKPAEDTEAGRTRAMELAKQLVAQVLRKELPPPHPPRPKDSILKPREVPILGPYLLPCQLRDDVTELYKKVFFRPIQGEPALGKPAVVLFIFVSDC